MKLVIAVVQGEDASRPAEVFSSRAREFAMTCLVEVQVGGATGFVVPVDSFEKI